MNGFVFNVQRYSLHDGPGIRTVVFLKGCPLRCRWCCNPESQRAEPEVEFRGSRCERCGRCLAACPSAALNPDLEAVPYKIDRVRCNACGLCVAACPNGALQLVGQSQTLEDVLAEVLRDAPYYRRSGGGMTLSGGEPLGQPDFARRLLQACYERNVHTAVETCGAVAWEHFAAVLPYVDLFLYDIKHMDSACHRRLTGVPNELILENARRLVRAEAKVVVRVPLIPGLNTEEGNLNALADFAASLGVREINLMPFHQLGKDKYRRLDRRYGLAELCGIYDTADGRTLLARASEILSSRSIAAVVGG